MEWFGGGPFHSEQDLNENMTRTHPHESAAECMASLCQRQQHCVKASIRSQWQLAEAQNQLCGLEIHSSESVEQERAQALASSTELSQTEQEWRHKESMMGSGPVLCPDSSHDVFDKSIINNSQAWPNETDHDKSLTSVQCNEALLKYFGMLRRWDDSQRFLSEYHHLICEETANYLILWCFRLQAEQKEALMEQVAHQAVVMQFILEMARNAQQDPRGCFRQFFQKAKAGQEEYLDVFHTELEAFKQRVKEYTMKSKREIPKETTHQNTPAGCRLDPKKVLEFLPPVEEYHVKLWTNTPRASKEESSATDEWRMMET